MGSEKVLENFSWGSWKSPGFFVSKRLGTLIFARARRRSVKNLHVFGALLVARLQCNVSLLRELMAFCQYLILALTP